MAMNSIINPVMYIVMMGCVAVKNRVSGNAAFLVLIVWGGKLFDSQCASLGLVLVAHAVRCRSSVVESSKSAVNKSMRIDRLTQWG